MDNKIFKNLDPILIAILIIIALIVLALIYSSSNFELKDRTIQECLTSERYTREECIILAGGK